MRKLILIIASIVIAPFFGILSIIEILFPVQSDRDDEESKISFIILFDDPGKLKRQIGFRLNRFSRHVNEVEHISDNISIGIKRAQP